MFGNAWRSLILYREHVSAFNNKLTNWKNICDKNNKSKKRAAQEETEGTKKTIICCIDLRFVLSAFAQGINSKSNLYWLVNDENKPFPENALILFQKHLLRTVSHCNFPHASAAFCPSACRFFLTRICRIFAISRIPMRSFSTDWLRAFKKRTGKIGWPDS